jgi:hypothetical protein
MVDDGAGWRHGVAVGLTPAGVRAVLGRPMRELTGAIIPLAGQLGSRVGELAGRLEAAPHWAARFAVLDDLLTAWLRPGQPHFNREIRAMTGITPTELRALVQYTDRFPG